MANFFRMQRNRDCPVCGQGWDGEHYVGEKAITNSEKHRQSRSRKSHTRYSQHDMGQTNGDAGDEAEEGG